MISTTSTCSLPPPAWNASRDPRGFLRFGTTVVMSPSTCGDAETADVLREIAPMRSDVAERGRGAALVGLEPPRIVRILDQPVLQVGAEEEVRPADVAAGDRVPRLLHERVAAVVERDRVHDAGLRRRVEQLLRLGGGHRERLVGDDVLPLGNRRGVDRIVQVVRRRVVDDVNIRIVEQGFVAAVGLGGAERVRFLLRRFLAAAGHRHDVDEPQTPDGIDVVGTDESGAHDAHSNTFHAGPPLGYVRVRDARRAILSRVSSRADAAVFCPDQLAMEALPLRG